MSNLSTIEMRLRSACPHCLDTTVTFDERGLPTICVPCAQGTRFSATVMRFADRVWQRLNKEQAIDRVAVNVARVLTHGDTLTPVSGLRLREWLNLNERQVKAVVETLRAEWTLPVVSRRTGPHGYWFASSPDEYLSWWRTHRAQAITELTTGWRNLKVNYSDLAGQGHLDFVTSITEELQEALR